MIDRLRPFAVNGLRVLLVDRGVLFVDFYCDGRCVSDSALRLERGLWRARGNTWVYAGDTSLLLRLHNLSVASEQLLRPSTGNFRGNYRGTIGDTAGETCQLYRAKIRSLSGGALYAMPVLILCVIYWLNNPERLPQSPDELVSYGVLIIAFLLAGVVLSFCIGVFLGILTFWLMQADFVLACLTTITAFLGGAIIPPSYWPEFIRPLMAFNPFQFFIAAPASLIISGDVRAGAAALGGAILYILLFTLIVRAMWRRAINTYTGEEADMLVLIQKHLQNRPTTWGTTFPILPSRPSRNF